MVTYDELKAQYDKIIQNTLKENESIIIESFVEYYGEEYRSLIKKKYKEITFAYYIDWEMISIVINEFIPEVENPEKFQIFKDFHQSHKKKTSFWTNIFNKNIKHDKLPENYVGTTNVSLVAKEPVQKLLIQRFQMPSPACCTFGTTHIDRLITFQILCLSELDILHEINHALTRDMMSIVDYNGLSYGYIEKMGLEIDSGESEYNTESILEELLNEKASVEIHQIFKRRGGKFSSFCYDMLLGNTYEENFYLVDEFYEQFKPYIKTARISENKNALVERIGKETYERFVNLVNKYFSDDDSVIEENKKQAMPSIKKVMDEMVENEKESKPLSKKDLEDYYDELRNAGYTFTVLNEPQEDSIENGIGIHRR